MPIFGAKVLDRHFVLPLGVWQPGSHCENSRLQSLPPGVTFDGVVWLVPSSGAVDVTTPGTPGTSVRSAPRKRRDSWHMETARSDCVTFSLARREFQDREEQRRPGRTKEEKQQKGRRASVDMLMF